MKPFRVNSSSSSKTKKTGIPEAIVSTVWTGIVILLLTSLSSSMFEELTRFCTLQPTWRLGSVYAPKRRYIYLLVRNLVCPVWSTVIVYWSFAWWADFVNVYDWYGFCSGWFYAGLFIIFKEMSILSKKRSRKYKHGGVSDPPEPSPYLYVVIKGEVFVSEPMKREAD